jgi:hypothetical protein
VQAAESRRAVAAAMSTARALDLSVDDAVVLSDSNRLVVRLMPCDTVARVTPLTHYLGHQASAEREVELVSRLARTAAPVATLDPRVQARLFEQDGFRVALWTYFEPVLPQLPPPVDYAQGLQRLHTGLREVELSVPPVIDRVSAVQDDVADRDVTPDLAVADRALLADSLSDLRQSVLGRGAPEQLLHGEPHPWNLLRTENGVLFIDFENACRGPVEYDLGWVPKVVTDRYPDADQDLVEDYRGLVLAMIAAYRWRRDDQHPSGRQSGVALLEVLRSGPPWPNF